MQILAYTLVVLIWGSTWYFVNDQVVGVPATWAVFYRFGLAALMLWIIVKAMRLPTRFTPTQHLWLVAMGISMFSLNYILVYLSTQNLTSGLVALAFSCMTFWNIVNARIFLKNPLNASVGVAAVLGLLGLSLIFAPEFAGLTIEPAIIIAIALALVAGLSASLGNTIAASGKLGDASPLSINAVAMTYGSLINVSLAFFFDGSPVIRTDPGFISALIFLSVIGTVVCFSVYLWLIRVMGVERPAYIAVLVPIVALVISSLFEDFSWSTESIVGLLLVFAGNVLIVRGRKSKPLEDVIEAIAPATDEEAKATS